MSLGNGGSILRLMFTEQDIRADLLVPIRQGIEHIIRDKIVSIGYVGHYRLNIMISI